MKATAPGAREYEIEAELLHEFRAQGAQFPAYGSIVAGGANACVLHYARTTRRCATATCC
jgi:Xaa-Pro aminopeptidase